MPEEREVTRALRAAVNNRGESNRRARVAVPLAAAVFLCSCALLRPEPEPVPIPQPARPVEVAPAKIEPPPQPPPIEQRITRNDQVILLPKADGSVGALVVRQEGVEIVLDKAYSSAVIEGPGQIRQLIVNPSAAREMFALPLAALPPRAASFTVYFLKGKDDLTADSKKEIGKILAELASRPAAEISVTGHTDTVGSVEFNDKLSLQRAERVRQLLTARGIAPGSISIAGRGERELLIPTQDEVLEPRNRRVEIGVR
jgi:outer membrane protein OmpA-like peptidoglycan-associated protein